jgi:hypothetical protein
MRLAAAAATATKEEPAPAKIGLWQLRIARPKHPIVRRVIPSRFINSSAFAGGNDRMSVRAVDLGCGPSDLNSCAALFVGFSDDRRFLVPVLILFVFFVLLLIIIRISRRRRIARQASS